MGEPASTPQLRLGDIEAPSAFKDDLALLDRYQAFSAELVRISLLSLSGLGAIIFRIFFDEKPAAQFQTSFVKFGIMSSAAAFGIAAAAALLHRYFSSDSMTCHLRVLRLEKAGRSSGCERRKRKRMLGLSAWSTFIATLTAAIGGVAFVAGIFGVLFHERL